MAELKLIGIGNSVGVVLPKDMLVKLGLHEPPRRKRRYQNMPRLF